jgi:hypothetical protein
MTTTQILHKLEQLEERMGARELPQYIFIIDYVESCEGTPTGRVTRVRYGGGGQILSEEEIEVPVEELLHRHQKSKG